MAHAFNTSTQETEAGESLNWKPAWSVWQVPNQPGIYSETMPSKEKRKKVGASEMAQFNPGNPHGRRRRGTTFLASGSNSGGPFRKCVQGP